MQADRPSDTATLIARSLLLASMDPALGALVPREDPATLTRILEHRSGRDWILTLLGFAPARWAFHQVETFLLPGIITHYLTRKRQIEAEVSSMIAKGCERVVVLGAGYDTLCWRLHRKHPDVQFVEIDHPATQQPKREALEPAANLHFQPTDLSQQLPSSALDAINSSTVESTAIVIEGLTMYLEADQVTRLLHDVAGVAGPKGQIIFTFMETDGQGALGFRGGSPLITRWLKANREPFRWGSSRSELPAFLESSELSLVSLFDHESLRRSHLRTQALGSLTLAEGELIATATPLPS